jgi:hypothetical protein
VVPWAACPEVVDPEDSRVASEAASEASEVAVAVSVASWAGPLVVRQRVGLHDVFQMRG